VKVTVERVQTFELRNLLGWNAAPDLLAAHEACLTQSTAIWLGRADGIEACAVGVIPLYTFSDKALLWMIHTRICEQHPLLFIRWSRKVLGEVLSLYPVVVGLCRCDNIGGRQWLSWLGAVFYGDPVRDYVRFSIGG